MTDRKAIRQRSIRIAAELKAIRDSSAPTLEKAAQVNRLIDETIELHDAWMNAAEEGKSKAAPSNSGESSTGREPTS